MMVVRKWASVAFSLISFAVAVDFASCQDQDSNDVIRVSVSRENILSTTALVIITGKENVTGGNVLATHCESDISIYQGENLTWPEATAGNTVHVTLALQDRICDLKVFRDCQEGGKWGNEYSEECLVDQVLLVLTFIGFSISLLACILAFIIFAMTRSSLRMLGHYQYHIHWNLISSFIFYLVVFLISYCIRAVHAEFVSQHVWFINLMSVLLAYSVLANFFWMLVEGLVLYVLVVTSFPGMQRGRAFVKWVLIGWGIPAVFVTSWIIVERVTTPEDSVFFLKVNGTKVTNYVCLIGPIFVALVINCYVVVRVMIILWQKLKDDARNSAERQGERSSWRAAKSTFVILILLGVYYVLPIVVFQFDIPFTLQYVIYFTSNLINSFQGLAVCTLYVFCNAEVRRALRNLRRRFKNNTSFSFTTRLTPTPSTSSRSATPRHSKSHSSSDGSGNAAGGKRPSSAVGGECIEMAVAASDAETPVRKQQLCVIMEPVVEFEPGDETVHGPAAEV